MYSLVVQSIHQWLDLWFGLSVLPGTDLVIATTIKAMLYVIIGQSIIPKAVFLAEIDVDTSIHSWLLSCCG
jgi:hypothetical protein